MFTQDDLYAEPIEFWKKLPEELRQRHMCDFDQSFLCGLIKKYRPKKILELGVAEGGTTAVILNCLSMLGLADSHLYSVDIINQFREFPVGTVAEAAKPLINPLPQHTLMPGHVFPEVADAIGGDIDFAIIDTAHQLPGELLDFVSVLPYLAPNAVVVVHDVSYHVIGRTLHQYASATLLGSVVADRMLLDNPARHLTGGYPNIGAFQVNEETRRYAVNLFYSLVLPWQYVPQPQHLTAYRRVVSCHYDAALLAAFDKAVELQRHILLNLREEARALAADKASALGEEVPAADFTRRWRDFDRPVVVYGYGNTAKTVLAVAKERQLPVSQIVVSRRFALPAPADLPDAPICHWNDFVIRGGVSRSVYIIALLDWQAVARQLFNDGADEVYLAKFWGGDETFHKLKNTEV